MSDAWWVWLLLYFAPAGVAMARGHRQALAIGVLNLVGGWTIIGWIVAIVWACTAQDKGASLNRAPTQVVSDAEPVRAEGLAVAPPIVKERGLRLSPGVSTVAVLAIAVGLLAALLAREGAQERDAAGSELPAYARSESGLLSMCAVASVRAKRVFVGAGGLSPVIGEAPTAVPTPGGAIVTCQVKTDTQAGWMTASLSCGDPLKAGCVTPIAVSLSGELLAAR